MQRSIWQGKTYSANWIVPKPTTASKWPINNPLDSLRSISPAEHSITNDWLKDLVALSAFSSFSREYFDPVIKADQYAQYVDDIGIAAKTPQELIGSPRAVFQHLRKAGLKLSMAKCHFGAQEVEFLGPTKKPNE